MQPRVTDNDKGEITVALEDRELRGWSYVDEAERRQKMLQAREYVEGWCDGKDAKRWTWSMMGDELDTVLEKYQLPRTMPIGWTDTDYERIADWVEPMRRAIERLREVAYEMDGK